MRWGILILAGYVPLLGCAAKPAAQAPAPIAQLADDEGAIAASLVVEPPLVANQPKLEIPREGRGPAAYAGFEEIISTYYYLRVDDRQLDLGGHNLDRFERRAVTTRVGVTYR